MKNRNAILGAAILIVLALIVYINRGRIHFDWAMFFRELHDVSWLHVVAGVACIYFSFYLRSMRWSVFLSATKKVSAISLVGPQFIGFAAVALFGRLADVIRPALIAKKVQLPVSSQVAVYTIERMFDLGAAAILFSGALVFAPKDLPHHEIFVRTGAISLGGTAFLAIFAVVVRAYGPAVARTVQSILSRLSKPLAEAVADKILGFRDGLNAIASAREFLLIALISLFMWALIGFAYVETLHGFATTPELAGVNFGRVMLLMGASIGGSLLQLPIIGWFTQIAVTATAMHEFYGAPIEAATACGAVLLAVTFLSIIPAGLLFARIDRISLKSVATESSEAPTASTS
jgi:glycosyltransferase 2 family protein